MPAKGYQATGPEAVQGALRDQPPTRVILGENPIRPDAAATLQQSRSYTMGGRGQPGCLNTLGEIDKPVELAIQADVRDGIVRGLGFRTDEQPYTIRCRT